MWEVAPVNLPDIILEKTLDQKTLLPEEILLPCFWIARYPIKL